MDTSSALPRLNGDVSDGFEPVRDTFARLWDDIEVGASLSVYRGGEPAINLWGGFSDRAATIPWQRDSLVNTYSTTKGIVALALALLVESGDLDYGAPAADYWPQFGAEKKFHISVAQLLSHQAGLYQFEPAIEVEALYDWQQRTFQLASQAPAWTPGTAFGYHSITWGFLAGELIRRISGMSPGAFIQTHLAAPLKAEFHLGVPEALQRRCTELIGPNHARKPQSVNRKPVNKSLSPNDPVIAPYRHICSPGWRSAEIPASNGHASAEGLAKIYAAIPDLLSAQTLAQATREQTRGEVDLVLGQPLRRAMGFILNCEDVYFGPEPTAFGHTGTGGSIAFYDPVNNIAFAYVMNQLHRDGSIRGRALIDALYRCL